MEFNFASKILAVFVAHNPPILVHLNSCGIAIPMVCIVSITSSNGINGSYPESAKFAKITALVAAIILFPKHGASTLLAIGVQDIPSVLCNTIEAAATD